MESTGMRRGEQISWTGQARHHHFWRSFTKGINHTRSDDVNENNIRIRKVDHREILPRGTWSLLNSSTRYFVPLIGIFGSISQNNSEHPPPFALSGCYCSVCYSKSSLILTEESRLSKQTGSSRQLLQMEKRWREELLRDRWRWLWESIQFWEGDRWVSGYFCECCCN